jgi:hypothetical protein
MFYAPDAIIMPSEPHDDLAYRLARKHVLDRVGHALQAVEGAFTVDERDELAWLG